MLPALASLPRSWGQSRRNRVILIHTPEETEPQQAQSQHFKHLNPGILKPPLRLFTCKGVQSSVSMIWSFTNDKDQRENVHSVQEPKPDLNSLGLCPQFRACSFLCQGAQQGRLANIICLALPASTLHSPVNQWL